MYCTNIGKCAMLIPKARPSVWVGQSSRGQATGADLSRGEGTGKGANAGASCSSPTSATNERCQTQW